MIGQFQKARDSGYSDEEIVGYLSKNPEYSSKIQNAKQQEYSDSEIVSFLSTPKNSQSNQTQASVNSVNEQPQTEDKGFFRNLYENVGKGLALQSQMSNSVTPRGAAQTVKGIASGSTFGLSENIPGLSTTGEPAEEIGKFASSLAPIHGLSKLVRYANTPIYKLAEKSPVFAKQLTALADIMVMGQTGSAVKATEDVFKGKIPEVDDIIEHGAEWALLDAVLKGLGPLGEKFISKITKNNSKPSYKAINEFISENKEDFTTPERVAAKVQSLLEEQVPQISNKKFDASKIQRFNTDELLPRPTAQPLEKAATDLSNRKLIREDFEIAGNKSDLNAQEYLPENINSESVETPKNIEKINIENIENKILESSENSALSELSERAVNDEELGVRVVDEIESGIKKVEEAVKPKYEAVKKAASQIQYSPVNAIRLANEVLEDINSLKTKPEGYQKVITNLNDSLKDMGYSIKELQGKAFIVNAFGERIPIGKQTIELFEKIPLSKSLELTKRLNKIIDFDLVGSSIKNRLKPLQRTLKKEIESVLQKENPEAFKLLKEADAEFAQSSEKFGRESIIGMRNAQAKEKITQLLKSSTALGDLKKVLSPEAYAQVEREILEKIRDMNFTNAKNTLRNIEHRLSPKAKQIAKDIVERKIPSSKEKPLPTPKPSQRQKLKDAFINDLSKDILQGTRPKNALDLWKTKKGQMFIQDALKGNENKEQVINYLKKQSFFDFAKSILNEEGKIDFKKFNMMLKDPGTRSNIKLVGGEEALNFFDNLEMFSKKLQKNFAIRQNLPVKELPKPKTERGESLLKRAAEKAKSKAEIANQPSAQTLIGKQKLYSKGQLGEGPTRLNESSKEYGKELLKKKAQSEAPFFFYAKEIYEGLPDPAKIAASLFGLFTVGPVKYLGAAKLTQALYKFATKPKLRSDMSILSIR